MITTILQVFGRFLLWMYNGFHSYALALIVFTLLTKLVLFPLSLKGKKSMMQTTALNAEVQKLQKQYEKDKARLQEETQKLYEREGVNPMSGCVWSLISLPILWAIYYIVRRPLLYMMCLTEDQCNTVIETVQKLGYDIGSSEIYYDIKAAAMLKYPDVMAAAQEALGDAADKLQVINFNMLGIDLAQTPTLKFWETFDTLGVWCSVGLFLVPIVVVLAQFGYSKVSQKTNSWNNQQTADGGAAAQSTKMMMYLMPLMYLWWGFIMPAGMCIYMMFSSIFMALQEIVCAKLLKGEFEKLKADQERRALEAKEAEKAKKAEIAARRAAQAEEAKKNRGKKKAKKGGTAAQKDRPTEHSRVGVRPYARGRAYDPDRYPVTPYHDPADVLDEAALEAEYARKGHKVEKLPEEPAQEPEAIAEAPVEAPAAEVTAEAPKTADEMFAAIQEEAGSTEESDS